VLLVVLFKVLQRVREEHQREAFKKEWKKKDYSFSDLFSNSRAIFILTIGNVFLFERCQKRLLGEQEDEEQHEQQKYETCPAEKNCEIIHDRQRCF
jgi:hypothetical protein